MHINYGIEIIEETKKMDINQITNIFNKIIETNKHNYYDKTLITKYINELNY
jgi:hypothetical protein